MRRTVFSCPIACCLGTPYRPSATSPGGGSKGRRGRRPLRRGPHPALRATFPVRGEGFGPPRASASTARTSSGASRHLPRARGRLWAAEGVGPYGGDLIRRFAPPSPCAGKALGRRCRDPSSAKQSLERRALPARRDAPQDDSEGHSRNSGFRIPNFPFAHGSGKRLAWRGGICYHTDSTLTQEERSLEHS